MQNGGYRNSKPKRSTAVLALHSGDAHTLRPDRNGAQKKVLVDNAVIWYASGERRRHLANIVGPLTRWRRVSGRENAAVLDPGQAFFQRQELCYFMPLPRVAEISEVKPPTPCVLKSGEARFE